MIDIDLDVYYEIVSFFNTVVNNYDRWNRERFEQNFLKLRKEKAELMFRVAAPEFLFDLETEIDETSELIREMLDRENPYGGIDYIEPFEGNEEDFDAYEEWFERNGLAQTAFFDRLNESLKKLDDVYEKTFGSRRLYFGTSREVLERLYIDFVEGDEFKDFVLCQYGDSFFVNVLGEWDVFSEAENIGYFYEEEFAEWIAGLTETVAKNNPDKEIDPLDVFNNTTIDDDEFCELVISYFGYKENDKNAEANAIEVLDEYL